MTETSDIHILVYTKRVPNRTMLTGNPFHDHTAYRDISLAFVGILAGAGYVPNGEVVK